MSVQGLDLNWSTNRKRKKEMVGRERRGCGEKANICLPPLCVALNENPNTGKDSVEGRPAAVLLKGSYLQK